MKKIFVLTTLIFVSVYVFAQVPDAMKYQTILRDNAGMVLQNKVVALRLSILSTSPTGSVVYSERQQFTTNDYGLVSLNIGKGSVLSGSFTTIDWSTGEYFMKVEIDIAGGTNYIVMGTSQLLSVPFAKYADIAGKSANDYDTSAVNEFQNLNYTSSTRTLDISSGIGVTIPLFTSSNPGLVNSSGGGTTNFLRADGTWTAPAGAIYDAGTGITLTGGTFSHTAHSGDATGSTSITIVGLQGRSVSAAAPLNSEVLKWNGSAWTPAADENTSFTAGNGISLSGNTFSANNTTAIWNANQLQGASISAAAPSNSDVLKWNGSAWAPATDNSNIYAAGSGITLSGNTFSIPPHSGDAIGSTSLTVVALQGKSVSTVAPSNTQVLKWNGSLWTPADDNSASYTAGDGITLTGNSFSHMAHTGDVTGSSSLSVVALRGRSITTTPPGTGSALVWNGTEWAMGATTDAFDGNRAIKRLNWAGVSGVNMVTTTGVADFLNAVFFPFLGATISINGNVLFEIGTTNSVNVSGTTTKNDETLFSAGRIDKIYTGAPTTVYIFGSSTTYSTTVIFSPTQVLSSQEAWYRAYQTVSNNGSPVEISSGVKYVQSCYPFLYGVSSTNLTSGGTATYAAFNPSGKLIQPKSNKTVTLNGTNGYIYFCYPASYGALSSILDMNLFQNISAFTQYTATVTSVGLVNNWTESYYIYKLNNMTTPSGWNFQFIY